MGRKQQGLGLYFRQKPVETLMRVPSGGPSDLLDLEVRLDHLPGSFKYSLGRGVGLRSLKQEKSLLIDFLAFLVANQLLSDKCLDKRRLQSARHQAGR